MRVSVITPSFKRASYIEATIQSVLNQTYKDIEYTVVDGDSRDGTVDILEKYKKEGKLTYISEPDNGMYDAINKGLKTAAGDVLAYLNADDLYFPWTVDTAVRALASNPGCAIVYGDTMVVEAEADYTHLNFAPGYTPTWLQCGGMLAQPTVFFSREVYEKLGGFAVDVKYIADVEYWLRAVEQGFHVKKINEFQAVEVNHGKTLRSRYRDVIEEEKRFLVDRYGCRYAGFPLLRRISRRLKYLEKEGMTINFIRLLRGSRRSRLWMHFREAYDIQCDVRRYLLNKILRTRKRIWSIGKKERV